MRTRDNRPEYMKEWQKKNKDKLVANSKKCRNRLRETVIAFLGGKCSSCGIDDLRVLQIDHVIGDGPRDRAKFANAETMHRYILRHPQTYQLLCANCNWIKRHVKKESPHPKIRKLSAEELAKRMEKFLTEEVPDDLPW